MHHWIKQISGVTAIEFSLVAMPLILMLIGTIEVCLVFAKQGVLEAATSGAARMIRTGQVQLDADPQTAFEQTLCDTAALMIDCAEIQYQVEALGSFDDADKFPEPEFDDEGNMVDQDFMLPGSNEVVLIRVYYRYPIVTPLLQPLLASPGQAGTRTMISTVVLQTEPYEFDFDADE